MKNPFLTPRYDSDKIQLGLMEEYKQILKPMIYQPVTILEIGIFKGGSMLYWDSYLKHPEARIVEVK